MSNTPRGNDSDTVGGVRVLYITCSSFSGSTLLSFLLNTHSSMVTIGHTTGWAFGPDEKFNCSCGEPLQECPFYQSIERAFSESGLPFDIRNFGTNYRLSANERLNDLLVGCLPYVRNSGLEKARDGLVQKIPRWSAILRQQDKANLVLMKSALEHARANVYVDNSHRPHRLRHLQRTGMFDLKVLHLVRDIRGVVLSHMKRRSWNAELATKVWMGEQSNALRIAKEFPHRMLLHYDDLCDDLDNALGRIHKFSGLEPSPFCGDFKRGEHHILGNDMRLRDGIVSRDTRWQKELSKADLETISRTASEIMTKSGNQDLDELLRPYLDPIQ